MKTQTDSLKWWNTLSKNLQNEYALEHYGVDYSLVLDAEIEQIYYDTQRYYVEFNNGSFLCLFPAAKKGLNKEFKTLNEALDYILVENKVKEVTIRN